MSLRLFCWLALGLVLAQGGGVSDIHTAFWEPSVGADGYRLYLAQPGGAWVQFGETAETEYVVDFATWPDGLVLFLVTAFNAAGESETEHGEYAGDVDD